jgi:GxxExxY protein
VDSFDPAPTQSDAETYAVIGAAMEVHRVMGAGFLESVYCEALGLELTDRCVPFKANPPVGIKYKERRMLAFYRPDFICFDHVIVEVKAVSSLGPVHLAQVINYLKATGLNRGLLLNFGATRLEYRRVVNSRVQRPSGWSTSG